MSATPKDNFFNLSDLRVLILEDFEFMADLMTSMLRKFKIQRIYSTCAEAEARDFLTRYCDETSGESQIDLVITDLIPPKHDGLKFLQWIRNNKSENIRYIPVMFCSAHTSQSVVLKGRDVGASEILVKPLSAEKLAHRLQYIIDNPRPFIKSPDFKGPDRRRKKTALTVKERRTRTLEDIKVVHEVR
jgi:CheY-like chemotaxis protein